MKTGNSARMGQAIRPTASPRAVLFLCLLGIPFLLWAGMRLLKPASPVVGADESRALVAARRLIGPELDRQRRLLEAENYKEAYQTAQDFVRSRLLPSDAPATFPNAAPDLTVTRLSPYRYRVRATVVWRDRDSQTRREPFETDLQYGPTDDRWRLVDTEFLTATPVVTHPSR